MAFLLINFRRGPTWFSPSFKGWASGVIKQGGYQTQANGDDGGIEQGKLPERFLPFDKRQDDPRDGRRNAHHDRPNHTIKHQVGWHSGLHTHVSIEGDQGEKHKDDGHAQAEKQGYDSKN